MAGLPAQALSEMELRVLLIGQEEDFLAFLERLQHSQDQHQLKVPLQN